MRLDEVKIWARTFAKAVAGRTNYFWFNSTTRVAELSYLSNPAIQSPTVVFVSERWINVDGYTVRVTPALVQWTYSNDHVVITHPGLLVPTNVTVYIVPKLPVLT